LASISWCVRLGAARRTREACLRYQEEHGTGTPPAASSPTWWRLAPRPLPAQLPSEAHAQHQYWEAQQLAAYKQWHGMCNAPSLRWPRLGSASLVADMALGRPHQPSGNGLLRHSGLNGKLA